MSREILGELDEAGIPVASTTFAIVDLPTVKVVKDGEDGEDAEDGEDGEGTGK
jgi:hypothetical protein